MAHIPSVNKGGGLTLTVLGCGTMGIAILSGILASLADLVQGNPTASSSGTSTPIPPTPLKLPTEFIACVKRPVSAKRVTNALAPFRRDITILTDESVRGAQAGDVILLCCKPQGFKEILLSEGMRGALAGKLVISILAGVSVQQMEDALYGTASGSASEITSHAKFVRVMPNTASAVRESMSVIATPLIPIPDEQMELIVWIFTRIGKVVNLPGDKIDACTALCGSGPAFVALMLEAMADGAVAMGVPRAEAQLMAAQTMRGASKLVLEGEHPAILRDKVSTPGGCTIGGLLKLEEGSVRGSISRAIREATVVASQLGKGAQGVNGTRF